MLHKDSLSVLNKLTKEQAGELFFAIKAYQEGEQIEVSPIIEIVFEPFKNQFIRDGESYKKTCEARARAGSLGGKQKVANASKCKQKVANLADSKKDKDSKKDSKKDSIKESIKKKTSRFAPPTHTEVLEYMKERQVDDSAEAEKFVDFYTSKGWKVGRNPMKDWKAATRNWLRDYKPPLRSAAYQKEVDDFFKP